MLAHLVSYPKRGPLTILIVLGRMTAHGPWLWSTKINILQRKNSGPVTRSAVSFGRLAYSSTKSQNKGESLFSTGLLMFSDLSLAAVRCCL